MDTLSITQPPKPDRDLPAEVPDSLRPKDTGAKIGPTWPTVRAVEGKFYGVTDHFQDKIVVMTEETWLNFGQIFENLPAEIVALQLELFGPAELVAGCGLFQCFYFGVSH